MHNLFERYFAVVIRVTSIVFAVGVIGIVLVVAVGIQFDASGTNDSKDIIDTTDPNDANDSPHFKFAVDFIVLKTCYFDDPMFLRVFLRSVNSFD